MTETFRQNLSAQLEFYLDDKNMSAAEFAQFSGVGESYISHIRNGKTAIKVGEKDTVIADKYYLMIAETIGMKTNKEFWKTVITPQMAQILATLEDAKEYGYTNVIIGETGCGKSFISQKFTAQRPKENFIITVGSTDTINDLLDKICEVLKLPLVHSKSKKISAIIKLLKKKRIDGYRPILIFDEAEYMKQATLCNVKELHDHLNKHCGLILIGTNQLEDKLDRLRKKNRDGVPQFYRRIKFGIRRLPNVDTTFKAFLKEFEITDKGLIKFLQTHCDNYGELHDVLVPAMREATRTGSELNENFVKTVLNIS